jgi:hypothetical protein
MALLGEQLAAGTQFTLPEMRKPPAIAFSPSRREIYVQGQTFAADDASRALQSEALLGGPGVDLPQGGDWVPLDEQAYQQYLQSIREPTLGRLASKSFGRGVDVTQALAGRALQLAGAEELGGRIVSAQEEDLAKTQPYERMFTDIESGRDAVEWLVANFAQQGPNLIESLFTAGAGYLAGTATGGPLAGAGGALAGLMGKSAFKESVKAAARKKATGEALTAAENKLLREAAGIAGAVTASYAQNLATGAADIYGELREQGATAEDTDARIRALLGSIPYAALETLPEYLLASRVLGGAGAPRAIPAGTSLGRRGLEYARRGGVGFGIGGLAEGTTEAGQEALLLGISGQDLGTDASLNRLINSFAAGFGVGGPIGGVANLRGNAPANLLNPAQNTDPVPQTPTPPAPPPEPRLPLVVAPGTQGDLFGGVGPVSAIPGVAPIPPVQPEPAITQMDLFDTGQVQGDLFGGPPPLVGPVAPPAPPVEAPAPAAGVPVIPGQLPFQFAPAAPTGIGFTDVQPIPDTQIAQQLEALRRQQEFDLAMAQRREAEIAQAEAQRQLQLVPPAPTTQLPTPRQARPAEPQQLPLFGARGLPRPSGAERLRRGATPLPETGPTVPVTPRESLQVAGQLPLFTQEGQPSVAALKGAGLRRKIVPTEEKGGKQRPSEPAAKIRQVAEKISKRQRVDHTYDDGSRFVGIIDNKGTLISGTYTYANGDVFEGTFRDNSPHNGRVIYANKSEAKYTKGEPTITKEAPAGETAVETQEEGPVEVTLELADGDRMTIPDGQKFLDKLDKDIGKYERFLACLNRK